MDYAFVLDCMADAFRVECRLPFVGKIGGEKQFYIDLLELEVDHSLPSDARPITAFVAQLMNRAEIIGKKLAAIANENLSELNEILIPSDCEFASWRAPIRMVVDYHIECDARICRFDIIGKMK